MGDFTNNNVKIGTCGRAYYATFEQLQKESLKSNDQEIKAYLNPANRSFFAFPYPEFDGKNIGDISIFHKDDRELFVLELARENKTFHKQITFHTHPAGGQGINLFVDCPCKNHETASKNFDGSKELFYLKYTAFTGEGGKQAIVGECIYCGETNIFEEHEAQEAVAVILKKADYLEKYHRNDEEKNQNLNKALRLHDFADRILNTYK